ncbi:small-conductance mechanosensitive channel [Candidatus Rickettsiella viridis]|uniref:Small-conductance mechanosensitive channel n=1 Tax=Candidatus Rickettsiella viridis TaxID=676208 RepID=A0A2Z5USX5_9COXI|nr:mechanosensitive ion channel domain-containing protein [Candidatus Rickettsiella viridis]BBB14686.1 small-conductance mechanosensitive channel [Candidatus Rickettsiella viridis]
MYKLIVLLVFLFGGFSTTAFAELPNQSPLLTSAQQQLIAEQTRSRLLAKKLQGLQDEQKNLYAQPITQKSLDRLDLMITMAKADLESINLTLQTTQQSTDLILDSIRNVPGKWQNLDRNVPATQAQQANLQQYVQERRGLFKLQQQRIKTLQQSREIIQQTLAFFEEWRSDLQRKYQLQEQTNREQSLDGLAARLDQEQKKWVVRLNQWNEELKKAEATGFLNNASYDQIEFNIFEAEERNNLLETELNTAKIANKLQVLENAFNQKLPLSTLSNLQHQIENINDQTQVSTNLLQKKLKFLQNYTQLVDKDLKGEGVNLVQDKAQLAVLKSISTGYQTLLLKTKQLQERVKTQQISVAQQLKLQLANRQGLPGWNLGAWIALGKTIGQIPALTLEKLASFYDPIMSKLELVSGWQWLIGMIGFLLWFALWLKLRRFLAVDRVRLQQRSRGFFSAQTVIVVLQLLQRHLTGIMLLAALIGLLFLLNIPLKLFFLIISVSVVCLGFSIVIQLAHILLLENTTDESGHDVKLYYRLRTTLLIGGIITLATILVNQLPVNYEVQDLFGRLFMFFLLVVALVLMKGWEVVPTLLEPYIENKHAYLKRIIRWLSFLIPFSLLTNALIGLVGYVELAWAIAHYQGLFLIALTAYLLLRGLLDELIRWASEQCIRRFRNGWLWSQALLKPFHQILKLALLLLSIMGLFELYGWGDRVPIINTNVSKLLGTKLFDITNTVAVTGLTVVQLAVLVVILIWIAHWSREFAYRWLFVHTKDLGLRNSLSIFTQYTLIAIGITIGLNILGLTWANISLIFGLFSLGVGLGLRDLFNNFFTGIFLLLERPVKVGDWVTIGNYDGQVSHIGARSITVTTDDRQELLVPNADIFSKNFINWTHRDSVVRALVTVKSNRNDNPNRIRDIILEVLATVPKILTNPKPEVYFKEIDKVLLEFKVEYYVDLNHISSRSGVRSQFLFSLWERFSSEGILPPEAPHDVHIAGKIDLQPSRG